MTVEVESYLVCLMNCKVHYFEVLNCD